jgi:hypothetical protein
VLASLVERRSGIATAPQKGKPLCVGFSFTLRNALAFTTANFYPDPLHLVEASYPWERLNAAQHQPVGTDIQDGGYGLPRIHLLGNSVNRLF